MILTPLHSQNFLDLQDGILTNNRRLVTKTMWFNGTEISDKAQRALRNERVTVVAHRPGYIHCLYRDATIDPKAYEHFRARLADYLSTDLTFTVFASFLRVPCHGTRSISKSAGTVTASRSSCRPRCSTTTSTAAPTRSATRRTTS